MFFLASYALLKIVMVLLQEVTTTYILARSKQVEALQGPLRLLFPLALPHSSFSLPDWSFVYVFGDVIYSHNHEYKKISQSFHTIL